MQPHGTSSIPLAHPGDACVCVCVRERDVLPEYSTCYSVVNLTASLCRFVFLFLIHVGFYSLSLPLYLFHSLLLSLSPSHPSPICHSTTSRMTIWCDMWSE
ncbi:unnamed protein product [Arctogadus glacialis]